MCFPWFLCFSQEPLYLDFSESEQLPSKTIYDLVEDSKGIIWLATELGVYSYNGKNFQSYTHPEQVGLSVFNLEMDDEDQLFYNNLANQVFYINDQQQPELFYDLNATFKGENTRLLNAHNLLIVLGYRNVVFIDIASRKEVFSFSSTINFARANPFVVQKHFYAMLDDLTFIKIELENFRSQTLKIASVKDEKLKSVTGDIAFNSNEDPVVVVTTVHGLKAFILRKGVFQDVKIVGDHPEKRIISSEFIDNELWLSTVEGAYNYQLKGDQLLFKQHLFKDRLVTKVNQDYQGNYWVATHDYGIFIIPNLFYKRIDFNGDHIPIKAHYNSKNTFLVHKLDNSVGFLDKEMLEVMFRQKEDIKYAFQNPFSKEFYVQTSPDQIITLDEKLYVIEKQKIGLIIKEIQFIDAETFICSSNITSGIYDLDSNALRFEKALFSLPGRSYGNAYDAKDKIAYFANINGLYSVNADFKTTELKENEASIFAKDVLYDARNDLLWVLKFKGGILGFKDGVLVHNLTIDYGLAGTINNYFYQYENTLWILGNKGIQIYDIHKKAFHEITTQDGLPSYDFKGVFIKEGHAFVSTADAVVSFQVDQIKKEQPGFTPYVAKFIADDVVYDPHSNIELPSKTQKADVFLNTNGYFAKDYITYQYQLNGGNWKNIVAGADVISFDDLSSGNYKLKIKAVAQEYESPTIVLSFYVATPFYKHILFYVFCLVGFAAAIFKWFQFKSKRAQVKQQQQIDMKTQELANIQLKLENLRSQMNPHFIFNALNSIQDYILKNETKLARHFLVKFSRLIRIYLEHSQVESISLAEEVEALQLYLDLERDRFSNDFDFSFRYTGLDNIHALTVPAFLLQPYVENAVKHGFMHKTGVKSLNIDFNYSNDVLIVQITDTGVGRVKSALINKKRSSNPSFSSQANETRITLLNKTRARKIELAILDLMNGEEPAGTRVTIEIPQ